jgi:16S rRNA (guanine(966)-N(2))-methyltransferase RsmD
VGIEALSRGADFCLFVDRDRRAIETINANLQLTDLSRKSEVRRDDSLIFLGNAPGRYTSFEVIFIAPPQYKNLWLHTLEAIDRRPEWLVPSGLAIIQIDPKEYEAPSPSNLIVVDQRKYGRSMLVFFERL